jgi:hypothetical protein
MMIEMIDPPLGLTLDGELPEPARVPVQELGNRPIGLVGDGLPLHYVAEAIHHVGGALAEGILPARVRRDFLARAVGVTEEHGWTDAVAPTPETWIAMNQRLIDFVLAED